MSILFSSLIGGIENLSTLLHAIVAIVSYKYTIVQGILVQEFIFMTTIKIIKIIS